MTGAAVVWGLAGTVASVGAIADLPVRIVVTVGPRGNPEALGEAGVEDRLADVPERRVAEVVAEPDRLGEVLVEPQRPRHGARDGQRLGRRGGAGPAAGGGRPQGGPGGAIAGIGGSERIGRPHQAHPAGPRGGSAGGHGGRRTEQRAVGGERLVGTGR